MRQDDVLFEIEGSDVPLVVVHMNRAQRVSRSIVRGQTSARPFVTVAKSRLRSLTEFRPPPESQRHDRDKTCPQHETPCLDLKADVDMALTEVVTE